MNTLEQILDLSEFLGLSHGHMLAQYNFAKHHRLQLWKRANPRVTDIPECEQKKINEMAMSDVNDHYGCLVLSYLQNESTVEKYILEHR